MAQMTVDDLVAQLTAAYGADLRSIVLYGSSVDGARASKRSNKNVLVLLERSDAQRLMGPASAASKAWTDAGNPAPLTMTLSEWRGSSDIFPMEYADILDRHKVLHGESPFEGIRVDKGDLRLQLEQEAMGKLIKLRQGVLASGNDRARQLDLLSASASAILIIFRAFLRLQGAVPPADNIALVQEVASLARFDGEPFKRVVGHARGEAPIPQAEAGTVLSAYLAGMEQLVGYLDRFGAPG